MQAPATSSNAQVAGPLLIGYLLNWGLHGVLCAQVYSYYVAFPNDQKYLKCLVYGVLVLETIQTGLATSNAFDTFATGFMQPDASDKVHLSWLTAPILSGIVGGIGQLFFAYRIKLLSGSWITTGCVIFLAVVAGVAGLCAGGQLFHVEKLTEMPRPLVITADLWFASTAACGILIASIMMFYLARQDAKFHPRSETILSRIIYFVVETGTLTAIITVISLGLFINTKHTLYFSVPTMVVAKLHANTMLVVFNNRMSIIGGRQDTDAPVGASIAQLGSRWRRQKESKDGSSKNVGPVDAVNVRTEVWTDTINLDRLELAYSINEGTGPGKKADLTEMSSIDTRSADPHAV